MLKNAQGFMLSTKPMAKRGRPKGSRNVVKKGPVSYSIGSGNQYTFPIGRDGNLKRATAFLSVGAATFAEALRIAVRWVLAYSEDNGAIFWPVVRYNSLTPEKRYITRAEGNYAYAECKDAGAWLSTEVLEAI